MPSVLCSNQIYLGLHGRFIYLKMYSQRVTDQSHACTHGRTITSSYRQSITS